MNEQNKPTTTAQFTELEKKQEAELQGVYTLLAQTALDKKAATDHLELFMCRVEEMITAQEAYFKAPTQSNLAPAKALEEKTRKALQALRRLGYSPDKYKSNTQKSLFYGS